MRHIRQFAGLMLNRHVPLRSKLVFIGVVGGYILMPLDILPDFLPLIGIVDDGTLLLTATALFSRYAKGRLVKEAEGKKRS